LSNELYILGEMRVFKAGTPVDKNNNMDVRRTSMFYNHVL